MTLSGFYRQCDKHTESGKYEDLHYCPRPAISKFIVRGTDVRGKADMTIALRKVRL